MRLRLVAVVLVLASCRSAGVEPVPDGGPANPGPVDAAPVPAPAIDAGTPAPADGGSRVQTACGAATVSAVAPTMLDHNFWGYHGVGTDGTDVYYPASLDGQLLRMPVSGARPTPFLNESYLRDVKAHDGRVCWMSARTIACKVPGGDPVVVHVETSQPQDSWELHRDFDFDATHVYWLDLHALRRAPLDGKGPTTTVIDGEETTRTLAVVGDRVVWGTDVFSVIRSCDKQRCVTPIELASFGRPPFAIIGWLAGDSTHVYVPVHLSDKTGRRGGRLVRIPAAGGPPETLADCLDESPVNVTVDGSKAYLLAHAGLADWSLQGLTVAGGSVYEVSLAGGGLRRLATGQSYPSHVTFTASTLLWMNEWDRQGELMSLPR